MGVTVVTSVSETLGTSSPLLVEETSNMALVCGGVPDVFTATCAVMNDANKMPGNRKKSFSILKV